MKTIPLFTCVFIALIGFANSASIVVNWSTTRQLYGLGTGYLSPGTPVADDGALLQLGYFSEGTLVDPFAGEWTILTMGSIGDEGGLDEGLFSITSILGEGAFMAPAVGTPLGVRFFDGTSIENSTYYNTAVNIDGSGLWVAPADPSPVINLQLAKGPTEFEAHSSTFQTTIPVPEPSFALLGGIAIGCLAARRKKA